MSSAIRQWLETLGLVQYGDRFEADDIDRISERGILRQTTLLGTRDGGAFENPMFIVGEVDEQGRYARNDS